MKTQTGGRCRPLLLCVKPRQQQAGCNLFQQGNTLLSTVILETVKRQLILGNRNLLIAFGFLAINELLTGFRNRDLKRLPRR